MLKIAGDEDQIHIISLQQQRTGEVEILVDGKIVLALYEREGKIGLNEYFHLPECKFFTKEQGALCHDSQETT